MSKVVSDSIGGERMPASKGHPKWGGRRKGTPNKINVATRSRIEAEADPIGFLCGIIRGRDVDGVAPTLEQRMNAAKILAGKVLPDLRSVEMEHISAPREITELTDEELVELVKGNGSAGAVEAA